MLAGCGKMESSELTAEEVLGFLNGGSPKHMGRCFRLWGKYYHKNNVILVSQQGKHRKTESLIHDEDVAFECSKWLKSQPPGKRTAETFNKFLNEVIYPVYSNGFNYVGSIRTACAWLNALDFNVEDTTTKKGSIYVDGHERSDVTKHRYNATNRFVAKYIPRMRWYSGEQMDVEHIPLLQTGEKEIFFQGSV
jgi:hypothetical protein